MPRIMQVTWLPSGNMSQPIQIKNLSVLKDLDDGAGMDASIRGVEHRMMLPPFGAR